MINLKVRDILIYFPLCFFLAGIIIHIVGLSNVWGNENLSLWNIWVDFSMLFIDIAAFYGLLLRQQWGYILSMVLIVLFGLLQLSLGILHIIGNNIPFEIQNVVTVIVCVIAFICLYLYVKDA